MAALFVSLQLSFVWVLLARWLNLGLGQGFGLPWHSYNSESSLRKAFMNARLEPLAIGFYNAEGPVWIEDQQKLVFSDTWFGFLYEWSEANGLRVVRKAPGANGNALDEAGRLVTCHHDSRNVIRTEPNGSLTVLCGSYAGLFGGGSFKDLRLNSPNDIAIQSNGIMWFTDPVWGSRSGPFGQPELGGNYVFRFDPHTRSLSVAATHLCMPNGIALSLNEERLYVCDMCGTPRSGLVAFEFVGGERSELRQLWRLGVLCDGLAVDKAGIIFAPMYSKINVIKDNATTSPGTILGSLEFHGGSGYTNCCFGGADRTTLFITSQRSLYSLRLPRGREINPYTYHRRNHTRKPVHPVITSSSQYHVQYSERREELAGPVPIYSNHPVAQIEDITPNTTSCQADYEFVHDGHCASGWIRGNSIQSTIYDCAQQCRSNAQCGYFSYSSADHGTGNCALYSAEGSCPDDSQYPAHNSYRMIQVCPPSNNYSQGGD